MREDTLNIILYNAMICSENGGYALYSSFIIINNDCDTR